MTADRWRWLGILGLAALGVLLRWPTFSIELWSLDEANTCIFASQIRDGAVLYRDAVDTRTPLLIYLLAAQMSLIGEWNMLGQHVVQALLIGLSAALLWRIAARLGAGRAGAWAAAFFTLLTLILLLPVDMFPITPEWLVVFFSGVGFWLLARAWSAPRASLALVAGACFGLSYLAKQPGLFDLVTAVTWLAIFAGFDPALRRRRLAQIACVLGGFIAVVGACWGYFAAVGAFPDYLYYTQTYSTQYYLPEVPTINRLIALRMPFRLAWTNAPLLAIGVGLGLLVVATQLWRGLRSRLAGQELTLLALGWTISGLLGSGLSGREYGHYAIQAIPGFSLLGGIALHALWNRAAASSRLPVALLWRSLAVLPLALAAAQAGRRLASLEALHDPAKIVGHFVRANTTPEERIFTWGFHPEVNFHAQRLSASRFIGTNFLTGMIPWTNLAYAKDTSYAIVPGAWDQFWQDFERNPPAAIIDTGASRGYIKYPLSRETRLWEYINRHYIEIGASVTHPEGFKVYRRTGKSLAEPSATTDPSLVLREDTFGNVHTGIFHVQLPPETRAAEFVINGRSTGAVTLGAGRAHQLTYTPVPSLHGSNPVVVVRARRADDVIVEGPALRVDENELRPAPLLKVGLAEISPAEKEIPAGMVWMPKLQMFAAHSPARMVYNRPATLQSVSFAFNVNESAYAPDQATPTDGMEIQVSFQPEHGAPQRLVNRWLNPRVIEKDRGVQHFRIALPEKQPGRLTVVITPGPKSDTSCDWCFISHLTGEAPPAYLSFRDRPRLMTDFDLPMGIAPVVEDNVAATFVHTPGMLAFALDSEMHEITGKFGMLSSSWNNPKGHCAGIDFIIEQVSPTGQATELWRRRLTPFTVPADRGFHDFAVPLADPVAGQVRFRALPANPNDNSYGYACWTDLVATPAR